jgi:hypothetical protein
MSSRKRRPAEQIGPKLPAGRQSGRANLPAELLRQTNVRDFFARIKGAVEDSTDLVEALGVWMGYPLLAEMVVTYATEPAERQDLWSVLNLAHRQAARRIMHAMIEANINATRFARSMEICQRVHHKCGGMLVSCPDRLYDTWPACVSDGNEELTEEGRHTVRDAEGDLIQVVSVLEARPRMTHSADFGEVTWGDQKFVFAGPAQRAVIRVLWQAWEDGNPVLTQATIQAEAEVESRLDQLFRGHPAWGKLIYKPGGRGQYTLREPR